MTKTKTKTIRELKTVRSRMEALLAGEMIRPSEWDVSMYCYLTNDDNHIVSNLGLPTNIWQDSSVRCFLVQKVQMVTMKKWIVLFKDGSTVTCLEESMASAYKSMKEFSEIREIVWDVEIEEDA